MDIIDFATGVALGIVASGIFFAGLALSVREAQRTNQPGALILGSAVIRISFLLLAGWSVAQLGTWSAIGFILAFIFIRTGVIMLARRHPVRKAYE